MHCCDTGHEPAVRLEHLDVSASKRLNRLIGILKKGFKGNGQLTLVLSGGNVDDIKFLTTDPPEDKKKAS